MPRLSRMLAAVALAVCATTVPMATALACSCGWPGYEAAIADADVAFIGTVVDAREPARIDAGQRTARYAFDVDLTKADLPDPFEIDSWFGGGGDCGLDMAIGEEWLIIASEWEGRLETHLCTGSTLTAAVALPELNQIKLALAPNDPPNAPDPSAAPEPTGLALDVPAPVIGIFAAALLVAGIGFVAFRRAR